MKPFLASVAAALMIHPLMAPAVEPGDSREAVEAELGRATGTADIGPLTILLFDRGEVKLRDGRVTEVNLISEEELAARRAAEAESLRRMEEAAQARLERLEAEGRAVYAAKKADPRFAQLPVMDQLAYWRTFAARYPMIPVEAEIETLMDRAETELRLRELSVAHQDRLDELEARVADAEERALRAEREARRDGYPYFHHLRPPFPGFPRKSPRTTPPQNPIDAARADAMADYEEARRRAYRGGAPESEERSARRHEER